MAYQELDDAIRARKMKFEAFKLTLVQRIRVLANAIPLCTRENSTPEEANAVRLHKHQFNDLIQKLTDPTALSDEAARQLLTQINMTNLRRPSTRDSLLPNSLDGSFRDSSVASSYGTPRSSSFSTPRSSVASSYGTPSENETPRPIVPTYAPESTSPEFRVDNGLIPTGQAVRRPSEFGFGGKKTRRR